MTSAKYLKFKELEMRKGKSSQKRAYSLLLIPNDGSKIRSIGFPLWKVNAVGIPLLCLIIAAVVLPYALLSDSGLNENDLAAQVEANVSAVPPSFPILSTKLIDDPLIPLAESFDSQSGDNAELRGQIEELEAKLVELYAKSNHFYEVKAAITEVFDDLSALGVPFSFDVNAPDGVAYALGGSDIVESDISAEELLDIAEGVDSDFSQKLNNIQKMAVYAQTLEQFFKVRPTGWPVNERDVVSEFGYRINPVTNVSFTNHTGVDIDTPSGVDVYATANGVVRLAEWNEGGYGYLVVIDHEYGYSTWYAHNSGLLVEAGEYVERGQLIALTGNTGRTTGAHCHYEVRINDVPQNPRKYLGSEDQ